MKARPRRRSRAQGGRSVPQVSFAQSELWETLEGPLETAEAIRALAALRERFEQALATEHRRAAD